MPVPTPSDIQTGADDSGHEGNYASYDYAVVRVVPYVARAECINVGVILFCRTKRFLDLRIELDTQRLTALAPDCDVAQIQAHLDILLQICAGAGPIGGLSQADRFHWLVSPRSTVIQISPVHSGLCTDPETVLAHLLDTMVRVQSSPRPAT